MFNLDKYKGFKYGDMFIFDNDLYTVVENNETSNTMYCTFIYLRDLDGYIPRDFFKVERDIPRVYIVKEIYSKETKDEIKDCLDDYIRFSAV